MRGIVLAGGSGTRLMPMTEVTSKQLLPVFDKPMIYYPVSTLMLAGIREILLISTPFDLPRYQKLLGDGNQFGLEITYACQETPDGLASAFRIGKKFIGAQNVCLVLGDNLFWGHGFGEMLERVAERKRGATVFGYRVQDPRSFGVIEFDERNKVISLEEKPTEPKSNFAATGLYFYDNEVVRFADLVKPSKRGEFEITDINNRYLNAGQLQVELLGRGYSWMDAGTPDGLLDAALLVKTIEKQHGFKLACLEEIALSKKWVEPDDVARRAMEFKGSDYYDYVLNLIQS